MSPGHYTISRLIKLTRFCHLRHSYPCPPSWVPSYRNMLSGEGNLKKTLLCFNQVSFPVHHQISPRTALYVIKHLMPSPQKYVRKTRWHVTTRKGGRADEWNAQPLQMSRHKYADLAPQTSHGDTTTHPTIFHLKELSSSTQTNIAHCYTFIFPIFLSQNLSAILMLWFLLTTIRNLVI